MQSLLIIKEPTNFTGNSGAMPGLCSSDVEFSKLGINLVRRFSAYHRVALVIAKLGLECRQGLNESDSLPHEPGSFRNSRRRAIARVHNSIPLGAKAH